MDAFSLLLYAIVFILGIRYIIQRDRERNALDNAELRRWAQLGSYFNWNGHSVFYRVLKNRHSTNNEHLVMVHGYPTSSFDFESILDEINAEDGFSKILLYDMLGHGFSDKPSPWTHTYSVMKSADLLIDLIKHTAIDKQKIHIFAHDLGDTVVQELLSRLSEGTPIMDSVKIASVCLLNGGIIPTVHRPLLTQKLTLNPLTRPLAIQVFNRLLFKRAISRTWGKRTVLTDDVLNAMWLVMTHKSGVSPLVHIQQYINERNKFCKRWTEALVTCNEKLHIPMMLINGVLDPISGGHMADAFETLVPKAEIVRLQDVGHWPANEAPNDVCKAFLRFVTN